MSKSGRPARRLQKAIRRRKDSGAISPSTGGKVRCPGCKERYDEQRLLQHLESIHGDLYWRLVSEAKDSGVIPPFDGNLLRYIEGRNRRRSPQQKRLDL
jgi:hypothetical protein